MTTFLCPVSNKFPENYYIGLKSRTWGVECRYEKRIRKAHTGDEIVFMLAGEIRSIHRIESEVFYENRLLWPTKDGDPFPYRIKISGRLYEGHIPCSEFASRISFMKIVSVWSGTIQGASGVFNDRLTDEDVSYLKSRLSPVSEFDSIVEQSAPRAARPPKIQSLFNFTDSEHLNSFNGILPSLGLVRYNEDVFPADYDPGYKGRVVLCREISTGNPVIVDFNRREAPDDTLLRVLHYMSWVRQNLAGNKNVSGIILAEEADERLKAIVSEVPNVSLRFYHVGIQLSDEGKLSA